jgi:NAD(P)-dependent dehydrogenase (short-subunit alcohol dehydrogenase family)
MSDEMKGKTVVITGASGGIGKETAAGLAEQGAHVVIVARDAARGQAVVDELKAKTGAAVELAVADLSSLASVRKLAEELKQRFPKIHVLVNNAGAINTSRQLTVDGHELTFATNHLAYFLLTNLLLDTLKASGPSRIVNVASAAHVGASIPFDDLQAERSYSGIRRYGESKLANILFTFELARRLEGSGVTANCLHPGVVATGFGLNNTGLFSFAVKLVQPLFISPRKGAATSIYLASSSEVAGVSGKYWKKCREARSSRQSLDRAAAQRLWVESERLTGLATA